MSINKHAGQGEANEPLARDILGRPPSGANSFLGRPGERFDSRTPPARLREARRHLLATGELAPGLIPDGLRGSWQRSHGFGLAPEGRAPGAPHASGAQLTRACEQQRELLAHARPVMEFLFDQTRGSDGMVVLADAQGMLLQALGDGSFLDRAQRVALRPGANWHEQWRGTNAIGTALAEHAPVVVHAGEHYLARNGFLTCTAAPILDPAGRVLGALDLSGDHRGFNRHSLALVCTAARMIEQRLFETRHAGAGLRLRLHTQAEGLGMLTEGLLALSDEGWLVGANATALQLLGLSWRTLSGQTIERLLQLDTATLWQWARQADLAPRAVRRPDGQTLWLRVEASQQRPAPSRPAVTAQPPQLAADALTRLDSGDAAMRAVIARARRVLDKPIALLLQGETGVGKEVFVRALHASSALAKAPLVAVNCAALPEHLIEAELFGYRPGAFTGASREGSPGRIRQADGGRLFLDEIGDLPLAIQGRLLRVLQEREVLPLGGAKPIAVNFQLVCATHRDLRLEMAQGRLRADLYYRLNGLTLQLPPLRERQDLGQLIRAKLQELLPERPLSLAPDLLAALLRYRWPGNLRQLHNGLMTACALLDDSESQIGWSHLPDDLAEELRRLDDGTAAGSDDCDLQRQTARTVQQTLQACAGNLSEAARRLGISRNTLYRKLGKA